MIINLVRELEPGDLVYRWWDAGIKMEIQPLQVIRVNRVTITVRTQYGNVFRLPYASVEGRVDWDEPDFAKLPPLTGSKKPVPQPNDLGSLVAQEGCDRCYCGCKYWENDTCVDCGTKITDIPRAELDEMSGRS